MFKITGYRVSEGEYNGHAYSNYVYDFMHNENAAYTGYSTSYRGMTHFIISSKMLLDIAGVDKAEQLVGKNVQPVWDVGFNGKVTLSQLRIFSDDE